MATLIERVGECDVCALVDDIHDEKVTRYCGLCRAWMCRECFENQPKRAKAAVMKGARALKRGMLDFLSGGK